LLYKFSVPVNILFITVLIAHNLCYTLRTIKN